MPSMKLVKLPPPIQNLQINPINTPPMHDLLSHFSINLSLSRTPLKLKQRKEDIMVFPIPMVLTKLADWLLHQLLPNSCHRAARKVRNYGNFILTRPNPSLKSFPNIAKFPQEGRSYSINSPILVSDPHGALLRCQSFFPYFMLVAFEAGGILRAIVLLLLCPVLSVLDHELRLRVMIFVTFCGLSVKGMESVSRAVLPKFYLDNLNRNTYEVLASATGRKVVVTDVPRVMVEGFLKEYLSVGDVIGTELHRLGGRYTGLLSMSGLIPKHRAVKDYFGSSSGFNDHIFISLYKEPYLVNKEDGKINNEALAVLPRENYPKPLVFHDGRLAFLPTPTSTLAMLMFLPLGLILSIFRLSIGIFLPYKLAILFAAMSGLKIRAKGCKKILNPSRTTDQKEGGILYVCNHRTLLDPVFLSVSLARPLSALTYSLSTFSEFISPIRTVRLTRDPVRDRETMGQLLSEGDLVICPEGTTCREPYLLRFSSLFAELADEIVPVAVDTEVSMFYGTTAGGLKCLDPIFFLMNPRPLYSLQIIGKLNREQTCAGGRSRHEVANGIQKQLADALGFECTALTRRDKYLMLAGNEGVVRDRRTK